MSRGSGVVLAVLALASTFGFGLVLFQALAGDFVGGEIGFVRTIAVVVGVVTVGLWAGTVSVLSGEEQKSRLRTYLGAGAVLALLAGAGVGFMTDTTDVRLLEVTMNIDEAEGFVECPYEGLTDEIDSGDLDVTFHNQAATGGTGWMDLVRVDDDKTLQDVIDFLATNTQTAPTWVTRVYLADLIPTESSSDTVTRTVQPGLHVVVCGTNSPYQSQLAGSFTVLP